MLFFFCLFLSSRCFILLKSAFKQTVPTEARDEMLFLCNFSPDSIHVLPECDKVIIIKRQVPRETGKLGCCLFPLCYFLSRENAVVRM